MKFCDVPTESGGVEVAFRDALMGARMFRYAHPSHHLPGSGEAIQALLKDSASDTENGPYRASDAENVPYGASDAENGPSLALVHKSRTGRLELSSYRWAPYH